MKALGLGFGLAATLLATVSHEPPAPESNKKFYPQPDWPVVPTVRSRPRTKAGEKALRKKRREKG